MRPLACGAESRQPVPSSRTIPASPRGTLPHALRRILLASALSARRSERLWRRIVKFADTSSAQPTAGAGTAADFIAAPGDRHRSPRVRRFDLRRRLFRLAAAPSTAMPKSNRRSRSIRSIRTTSSSTGSRTAGLLAAPAASCPRSRPMAASPGARAALPVSRCGGGNAANSGDYARATDPWVTFSPNGVALPDGARIQRRFTAAGLDQRDAGGALHRRWAQLGSDHVR